MYGERIRGRRIFGSQVTGVRVGVPRNYEIMRLFENGELGTFLDFRPEYTYTDTAGTVPAGAGDFIANAGDRSPNGADAVQATSAARARLSARYNRLDSTDAMDSSSAWNQTSFAAISPGQPDPDGGSTAYLVTARDTLFGGLIRKLSPQAYTGSTVYRMSCIAKAGTHSYIGIRPSGDAASLTLDQYCFFNLSSGVATAITPRDGSVVDIGMVSLGGGWQYCYLDFETAASVSANATDFSLVTSSGEAAWTPTGSETVYIWHPDLRLTRDTDKPAYQRVGDLTADPGDYDTVGFPYYADLDLADDVLPVTLPAITGGTVVLVGLSGIYYEESWDYAGGTLNIGPTSVPGLPDGILSVVGGLCAVLITDRALTSAEKTAVSAWGKARGAAGVFELGPELVVNGTFDADTDWTKGTGWTIGAGVATKAAGNTDALSQASAQSPAIYLTALSYSLSGGTGVLQLQGAPSTNTIVISGTGETRSANVVPNNIAAFRVVPLNTSFAGTVDNISVRKLELVP